MKEKDVNNAEYKKFWRRYNKLTDKLLVSGLTGPEQEERKKIAAELDKRDEANNPHYIKIRELLNRALKKAETTAKS